jgi:pyruvate dehydrogenase E1 component alpha subunit
MVGVIEHGRVRSAALVAYHPRVAVGATTLEEALAASMPALARAPEPFKILDADGRLIGPEPELAHEQLLELYRWMIFGRQLDERGLRLQRQGRVGVWGPMTGQEAAQAGLGLVMRDGDWMFPSYREAIALCMRGLSLADLFAYYRGLYWQANPAHSGIFPVQIVIGDQSLHAVGAGMAFALRDEPRVAVGVVGDGATSQGDFLEALNFAGVFNAHTVLFVQNNQWAISMPRSQQTASETLAQKGLGQGVTSLLVDGNDVLAVYAACDWAFDHARRGHGPVLIEALTYRIGAHTTADDPRRYQPADEIDAWRARDPLPRFEAYLRRLGIRDATLSQQAVDDALQRIDVALEDAEARATPAFSQYLEVATPGG